MSAWRRHRLEQLGLGADDPGATHRPAALGEAHRRRHRPPRLRQGGPPTALHRSKTSHSRRPATTAAPPSSVAVGHRVPYRARPAPGHPSALLTRSVGEPAPIRGGRHNPTVAVTPDPCASPPASAPRTTPRRRPQLTHRPPPPADHRTEDPGLSTRSTLRPRSISRGAVCSRRTSMSMRQSGVCLLAGPAQSSNGAAVKSIRKGGTGLRESQPGSELTSRRSTRTAGSGVGR